MKLFLYGWALTGILLCQIGWGRNYALVVAGESSTGTGGASSHDFAVGAYKTTSGLIRSGYETQLLFSPQQGKATFQEGPSLTALSQKDTMPKVVPSTRDQFLASVKDLAQKVQPGEKVFLNIMAHGGTASGPGTAEWNFCLTPAAPGQNCERVRDADVTAAVQSLQARGAQVALVIESCHSGSFQKQALQSLREPGEGKRPACVITSSLENQSSEGCMAGDYDGKGKLLNRQNRSVTSANGFIHAWLHWRSHGSTEDPLRANPCWSEEAAHFRQCRERVRDRGIPIDAQSSLKDVMRAARFCDGTSSFLDSTGEGTANRMLSPLLPTSLEFLYPGPGLAGSDRPVEPAHGSGRLDGLDKNLGRPLAADASPYEKAVQAKATPQVAAYRDNLRKQREHLAAYAEILKNADDRVALRGYLQKLAGPVEAALRADHQLSFRGDPRPGSPPNPPVPTLDTADRLKLLFTILRLAQNPETSAEDRAIYSEAVNRLHGGAPGLRALRALAELQADQNRRFQDLIAIEREIYDATLGQRADSCSGFTL